MQMILTKDSAAVGQANAVQPCAMHLQVPMRPLQEGLPAGLRRIGAAQRRAHTLGSVAQQPGSPGLLLCTPLRPLPGLSEFMLVRAAARRAGSSVR